MSRKDVPLALAVPALGHHAWVSCEIPYGVPLPEDDSPLCGEQWYGSPVWVVTFQLSGQHLLICNGFLGYSIEKDSESMSKAQWKR